MKSMKDIIITIDGEEMSLDEYLLLEEKKRKKELGEQASDQFATHSGEYAFAAGVGQRKYKHSEPEPKGKKRVTYNKRYSTDEIMEEEMADSKELRTMLLKGLMAHQDQWITKEELGNYMNIDNTEGQGKKDWHNTAPKLLQFLILEELVVRKQNPSNRRGFIYKFKAFVEYPDVEIPLLETKYRKYVNGLRGNEKAKRIEKELKHTMTDLTNDTPTSDFTTLEATSSNLNEIMEGLKHINLTVHIKVEVRFGLLK